MTGNRRIASILATGACILVGLLPDASAQDVRRDEPGPDPQPTPTLTQPPVLLQAATPEYPEQAIRDRVEGAVGVRITIDARGAVTAAEVIAPLGHGLDEAALAAARQYQFKPAEWDGVPGPITVETAIRFVLDTSAADEPDPSSAPGPEPAPGEAVAPGRGTIAGRAIRRGSRAPIAGAQVALVELGMDAITDEQGRFEFAELPPGNYTVLAVDAAHARFSRRLELDADEALDVTLYLRPRASSIYETVVEGEAERLEVTRRTIDRRQMTSVPGTFGDPIRVIQALPGLARAPFSTGFLLIRGSNPGESGVFIDGHQVPLLFHSLGGPSFLNPEFLGELRLYPGGFPARFGRATGGVVAVDSRSPKATRVTGSADIDVFDAGGYVATPVGKRGGLAVAARQSYFNLMLPLLMPDPDEGQTLVVTPVYRDYNARFDYNLGKSGQLSLFVLGSTDRLDVVSSDHETEQTMALGTDVDFTRVIGSYRRPLSGGLQLTLSTAIGRDTLEVAGSQGEAMPAATRLGAGQDVLSSRMRVHGQVSPSLHLDTGLDVHTRRAKLDLLAPLADNVRGFEGADVPTEQVVFNSDELGLGAHVEAAWDVGAGLKLVPGLRLDSFIQAGEARVSADPRLVARWRIGDAWTAKAYAGLFHRASPPITYDSRFGNPDLELERAVHTGIGAEWRFAPHWSADVELYVVDRKNQVVPDEAANFTNAGSGRTIGGELMIRREVTDRLYGWLSYTLSRTETRTRPDDPAVPAIFDQTHVLNAVASYRLGAGWELGARYRLATGVPETPVIGGTFDADQHIYRPLVGDELSERRPTFNQVDVRVEKTWRMPQWSISAYLDIQNLLNSENVEATQYDYRYRDSAPITSLPFVPTVGVKGTF